MARIIHEVQPSLCNSAQNSYVAPNKSNSDTQTSKNDQLEPSPAPSEAQGTDGKPFSPGRDSRCVIIAIFLSRSIFLIE